jgi:flagellar basal-body rod protein FlgB
VAILGPALQSIAAALEVRSARADLLAGNVANADTPGYRAVDLDFASALSDQLEAQNLGSAPDNVSSAVERDHLRANLQFDRNDVDVSQQLAKAFDNSLNYVATLKLYGDSVQRIVNAASTS